MFSYFEGPYLLTKVSECLILSLNFLMTTTAIIDIAFHVIFWLEEDMNLLAYHLSVIITVPLILIFTIIGIIRKLRYFVVLAFSINIGVLICLLLLNILSFSLQYQYWKVLLPLPVIFLLSLFLQIVECRILIKNDNLEYIN